MSDRKDENSGIASGGHHIQGLKSLLVLPDEKDNRTAVLRFILYCVMPVLQGYCVCRRDDKRAKAAAPAFRQGCASFDSGSGRQIDALCVFIT